MNNCDNWYEMTEQALSTIDKLMPTETPETNAETFQSTPTSKNFTNSSSCASPSDQLPSARKQEMKASPIESQNSAYNEEVTSSNLHPADVPYTESSSQKPKSISPIDHSSIEREGEKQIAVGRGVTLAMLMTDGLIKAGVDAISFEHLGEKFNADLLPDGKIMWNERIFHCTSSWIVHCKKTSFPMEKLTCSVSEQVKHKGKTIDYYKLLWLKKHKPFVNNVQTDDDTEMDSERHEQETSRLNDQMEDDEPELNWILSSSSLINYQESIPHAKLGRRSFQGIPSLFVECSSFTKINRVQPFKLNITKNCLLLLHFHCHLSGSEVVGYLAGKWDSTAQQLIVNHAYPCKCSLNSSKDETDKVEYEIMTNMDKSNLILVGWYHSHVGCPADPSLRDVETQMEYQFQLKGYESATFQPCIGLVVSPFHMQSPAQLTSDMKIFYVYPPSEQRPLDYGMPLEVEHTISKDDYITDRIINEMDKLIKFYSGDPDYLPKKFKKANLPVYLNKLKNCLSPFCPSGYLSESIVKVFESL